jgi:hypothetical protein
MIQYFDNLRLYSLGSKNDYPHMDTYDSEPFHRLRPIDTRVVGNGRSSSKLNLESCREESVRRTLDHFSHRGSSVRKHNHGEC